MPSVPEGFLRFGSNKLMKSKNPASTPKIILGSDPNCKLPKKSFKEGIIDQKMNADVCLQAKIQ